LIKLSTKIACDRTLVALGLSEGNCQKLKEGDPILFPCSEVGIDDKRKIIVVYDDEDFRSKRDLLSPTKVAYCLCLDDETIKELQSGTTITNTTAKVDFVFFYGETEAEMAESVKSLIGPGTRVINRGFDPSAPKTQERN